MAKKPSKPSQHVLSLVETPSHISIQIPPTKGTISPHTRVFNNFEEKRRLAPPFFHTFFTAVVSCKLDDGTTERFAINTHTGIAHINCSRDHVWIMLEIEYRNLRGTGRQA